MTDVNVQLYVHMPYVNWNWQHNMQIVPVVPAWSPRRCIHRTSKFKSSASRHPFPATTNGCPAFELSRHARIDVNSQYGSCLRFMSLQAHDNSESMFRKIHQHRSFQHILRGWENMFRSCPNPSASLKHFPEWGCWKSAESGAKYKPLATTTRRTQWPLPYLVWVSWPFSHVWNFCLAGFESVVRHGKAGWSSRLTLLVNHTQVSLTLLKTSLLNTHPGDDSYQRQPRLLLQIFWSRLTNRLLVLHCCVSRTCVWFHR